MESPVIKSPCGLQFFPSFSLQLIHTYIACPCFSPRSFPSFFFHHICPHSFLNPPLPTLFLNLCSFPLSLSFLTPPPPPLLPVLLRLLSDSLSQQIIQYNLVYYRARMEDAVSFLRE